MCCQSRTLLLAVFFSLAAKLVLAQAGQVYRVNPGMPVQPLDAYTELLADTSGSLTFKVAREKKSWAPLQEAVQPYGPKYTGGHLGLEASAYFTRLRIRAESLLTGWQLHFEDRLHHNIAWIRGNGRVEVRAYVGDELLWTRITGADVRADERDVPGRRTLDRIRMDGLPPGETVTLIARLEPNGFDFPAFSNASLRSPEQLDYHPLYSRAVLFNAVVLGATAIMFFAHLLLFAYLRERVYGWLALWLLFAALTHGMTVGIEPAGWLPFHHSHLRVALWIIIPSNMLFSFWLFGRAYVGTAKKYPWLDRAMLAIPVVMAVVTIVQVVRVAVFDVPRPFTALPGLYASIGVLAVCGLVLAGILATRRGDALARYFGVGALIASGFLILAGLWAQRLVVLGFDPFAAGTLAQVVVYSFGLAYRQQIRVRAAHASEIAGERARGEVERMRELDVIKARFFANVSHEFRTPLSLVLGPLDRAKKRAQRQFGEEANTVPLQADEYGIIHGNARRLVTLVDQLLDLSRLEHGNVFLQLHRGDLVPFLKRLIASFESLTEREGISLSAHFPEDCPTAFYDEDKLTKIISNLISNAVKYTPPQGAVSVVVQCEASHFTIEVSDTGSGIDEAEIGRIFERFYRVSGTETAGTGIGLALTKELVDLHSGTIGVQSSVGQGTTFRVRLPHTLAQLPDGVTAAPDEPQALAGENEGNSTKPYPSTTRLNGAAVKNSVPEHTILVVEDNTELREFIGELLADDYRVLGAVDGKQGERMAIEHLPDLVVSDVMMPGQDGYSLCHALKTNAKTSHVPVILLTARTDQHSTLEGLTQGADDYLTKPFNADELLLRIRNLLERRDRLWTHFQSLDLTLLPEVDARSLDDQFVHAVARTITEHLGDAKLSVEMLARKVGYSRSQLTRKLRAVTGKTPNALIMDMRLHEAQRQLERGQGSVSEIGYRVGFSNMSYFAKRYREAFGIAPSQVEVAVER